MLSDFDNTQRIIAFPVAELMRLGDLVALYGAELPIAPLNPDSATVRCLAGAKDQSEGELVLRALSHPETANTTPLTDGRHAYSAHWSLAIIAALLSGSVQGEELSASELQNFLPSQTEF